MIFQPPPGTLTADEARQKKCQKFPDKPCEADGCMAWIWTGSVMPERRGYCRELAEFAIREAPFQLDWIGNMKRAGWIKENNP